MDLEQLELQLKKRWLFPHTWNYKFSTDLEQDISFIYSISTFDDIIREMARLPEEIQQYALNRWYNFWSQKAVYQIFAEHPQTTPIFNHYDEAEAFLIQNIPFKIKFNVFPYHFARTLRYAIRHKEELVYWYYRKTQASSTAEQYNQLFIILYQRDGEHWRMKAEFPMLSKFINSYLDNFDIHKTIRLHLFGDKMNYADIIWCIREE